MIQNLILSIGLSFAIGLNGAKDNQDNFINNDTPNNVVYDDEDYQITLNANELNNYTWENLYNAFDNNEDFGYQDLLLYTSISGSTYLNYNSSNYNFYGFEENEGYTIFVYVPIDENDYKFIYENDYTDENVQYPFDFNVILDFSQMTGDYLNFKNAIELDIQANSAPSMSDFLTILNDIVSLLTGGLINMGTGLGNGLNSIVTSLAIDNGGMSIFLAVIGIFGGIALAVGLTRRIFSWIESLGARR